MTFGGRLAEVRMLKRWMPVLVVDDSTTMCAVMKKILRSLDFDEVESCRSALEAFEELKQRDYGFVLCDVEMRPVSGVELVRMMRRDKFLRHVPVILTTGNPVLVTEMFKEGQPFLADGFILKPFKATELRDKLAEVLEAAYPRKELLPPNLARLSGFERA
jgi:two-component system chemotaxis response regulator CheY